MLKLFKHHLLNHVYTRAGTRRCKDTKNFHTTQHETENFRIKQH